MIKRPNGLLQLTAGYDNPLARQRAAGLFGLTWLLVAACAVWLALVAAPALLAGADLGTVVLPGMLAAAALILILALVQARRLELASWLFVGLLLVLCLPPALNIDSTLQPTPATAALTVVPLVAAGLLLDRRGLGMIALLVLAAAGMRAYLETNAQGAASADALTILAVLAATTVLLLVFGGQLGRALAQAGRERAVLSGAAGYVHLLETAHDEDDLFMRTATLIHDEMGYALAQIYLVDDAAIRRTLRPGLSADNLTPGEHDRAVVRSLAETRLPVLTTLTNAFAGRLTAPERAALTVPVIVADRLVAAIDVHTHEASFSPTEADGLAQLAAQLGMHLSELRLFEDLRQTIREQEAARDAEPAVRRAPAARPVGQDQPAGFDLTRDGAGWTLTPSTEFSPDLRAALESPEPYVEIHDRTQRLFLPVRYRGETLGAMTFDVPAERSLGERQIELARIVGERLGQALENARLFEQSQLQAQREHKANEVANALISATDVRAVLALAAESFNEAMGAVATRVTLQPDPAETARAERAEGVAP